MGLGILPKPLVVRARDFIKEVSKCDTGLCFGILWDSSLMSLNMCTNRGMRWYSRGEKNKDA